MLVLATFFWALSFPVIKSIMLLHGVLLGEEGTWFSTLYTVAPRFVIATGLLLALYPGAWRMTRAEFVQGLAIGVFAAAGLLFQNDALHYTSASTSAFLTQFYAITIPIWLALRARRNPGVVVWTSCALVLAGVANLGGFDWRTLQLGRGEWETLLASLFFMGQILWLGKAEYAGNRPERVTLVMFAVQALVFCALAGVTAPSVTALVKPWTSGSWLGLTAILAVLSTLGSYLLMNHWQPKITPTEAGLVYCIEPIFASVLALFLPALFSAWAGVHYPNERATWTLLIGGGLITAANVLLQTNFKRAEK